MYALYLWPGICETVLGAGNTRLSATFLSSRKSFWLTIIWTGSKARQRIMLMKTIKFVRSTQYRLAVYILDMRMPNPTEPTSNSIFALQLQMMAINFTLHAAEDKGLGSLLGCPPSWFGCPTLAACLVACLARRK